MIRYDLVLNTFSLFILKIPDSILCLQRSDSFKIYSFFVCLFTIFKNRVLFLFPAELCDGLRM